MSSTPNDENGIPEDSTGIANPNINEEELDEILEEVPERHRKTIEKFMIASSVQMRGMVSPENAIMEKVSEEHITEYLKGAREEMQNSFSEKKQNKIFIFFTLLASFAFFCVIIILLKDNPEVMEKIIYALIGLVAGAFGGYGVGKNKGVDNN